MKEYKRQSSEWHGPHPTANFTTHPPEPPHSKMFPQLRTVATTGLRAARPAARQSTSLLARRQMSAGPSAGKKVEQGSAELWPFAKSEYSPWSSTDSRYPSRRLPPRIPRYYRLQCLGLHVRQAP